MIFVSSWDDGHPLDMRIAELLAKYGLQGTFYVPGRNCESRSVMTADVIRQLSEHFEIASHTLDHKYLDRLSSREIDRQIRDGKSALEGILCAPVNGFCYPGGRHNTYITRAVQQAGFHNARTIENLRLDSGIDRYKVPTTVQFFPHRRATILRNFARRGHFIGRAPALIKLCASSNWTEAMFGLLRYCAATDGVFHLWGHSWELEEQRLWRHLESLLSAIAECKPVSLTVSELAATIESV